MTYNYKTYSKNEVDKEHLNCSYSSTCIILYATTTTTTQCQKKEWSTEVQTVQTEIKKETIKLAILLQV